MRSPCDRVETSPVLRILLNASREFFVNFFLFKIPRSEDGSGGGKKLTHSGLGSPDGDSSSGESQDEKPSLIDSSSGFLSHHHHHHHHHHQLGLNPSHQKSSPSSLNLFSQHQMVRLVNSRQRSNSWLLRNINIQPAPTTALLHANHKKGL